MQLCALILQKQMENAEWKTKTKIHLRNKRKNALSFEIIAGGGKTPTFSLRGKLKENTRRRETKEQAES